MCHPCVRVRCPTARAGIKEGDLAVLCINANVSFVRGVRCFFLTVVSAAVINAGQENRLIQNENALSRRETRRPIKSPWRPTDCGLETLRLLI